MAIKLFMFQLNQVETVVQSRLSEQDKIWKKKMDQMKQRHNEQMDEVVRTWLWWYF